MRPPRRGQGGTGPAHPVRAVDPPFVVECLVLAILLPAALFAFVVAVIRRWESQWRGEPT